MPTNLETVISDHSTHWEILPRSASFDDICEAIRRCENSAEEENDEMFNRLCDIAEECYKEQNAD